MESTGPEPDGLLDHPPDSRRRPLWRRALVPLAVLALIAAGAWWVVESGRGALRDVELWSEGGPGEVFVRPGARLRLSLRLARPAAVIVVLQDPSGSMEEVWPPPGDVPLSEGPLVLPRGGSDAWHTDGLDDGSYLVWVLAAREAIPGADRPALIARMRAAVPEFPRQRDDSYDLLRNVLKALEPRVEEIAIRTFHIAPR